MAEEYSQMPRQINVQNGLGYCLDIQLFQVWKVIAEMRDQCVETVAIHSGERVYFLCVEWNISLNRLTCAVYWYYLRITSPIFLYLKLREEGKVVGERQIIGM